MRQAGQTICIKLYEHLPMCYSSRKVHVDLQLNPPAPYLSCLKIIDNLVFMCREKNVYHMRT